MVGRKKNHRPNKAPLENRHTSEEKNLRRQNCPSIRLGSYVHDSDITVFLQKLFLLPPHSLRILRSFILSPSHEVFACPRRQRLPRGTAGMWKRMSRQCRHLLPSPSQWYRNDWNRFSPFPSLLTTGRCTCAPHLSGLVSISVIQKRKAPAGGVGDTVHQHLHDFQMNLLHLGWELFGSFPVQHMLQPLSWQQQGSVFLLCCSIKENGLQHELCSLADQ